MKCELVFAIILRTLVRLVRFLGEALDECPEHISEAQGTSQLGLRGRLLPFFERFNVRAAYRKTTSSNDVFYILHFKGEKLSLLNFECYSR